MTTCSKLIISVDVLTSPMQIGTGVDPGDELNQGRRPVSPSARPKRLRTELLLG